MDAREHGFAHHSDRRYPLIRRAIVPGVDGDDKIEVRHDEQSLSTITEAADPTASDAIVELRRRRAGAIE